MQFPLISSCAFSIQILLGVGFQFGKRALETLAAVGAIHVFFGPSGEMPHSHCPLLPLPPILPRRILRGLSSSWKIQQMVSLPHVSITSDLRPSRSPSCSTPCVCSDDLWPLLLVKLLWTCAGVVVEESSLLELKSFLATVRLVFVWHCSLSGDSVFEDIAGHPASWSSNFFGRKVSGA